jgi:hypothetical protein
MQNQFITEAGIGHRDNHDPVAGIHADMRNQRFVEYRVRNIAIVRSSFAVPANRGLVRLSELPGYVSPSSPQQKIAR